jgi:hypothetical protein
MPVPFPELLDLELTGDMTMVEEGVFEIFGEGWSTFPLVKGTVAMGIVCRRILE